MKVKSLKVVLGFWQEIIFVIQFGLLLIMIANYAIPRRAMDGADIFMVCFLLPLFICLIAQFFLKSETLSYTITPLLVLYSLFWVFVSFAMPKYIELNVPNPNNYLRPIILIAALFLVFAAITMPRKYNKNTVSTLTADN
jgi:drug/metabolite transporter (DMT)-like permease